MNQYKELKEYLKTQGCLQEYLDNLKRKNNPKIKLTLGTCSLKSKVLDKSFCWSNTSQGHFFWSKIHRKLQIEERSLNE